MNKLLTKLLIHLVRCIYRKRRKPISVDIGNNEIVHIRIIDLSDITTTKRPSYRAHFYYNEGGILW